MAVPTGTASLLDIQNEFGGAAPISLSEYYGAASGVPTSGAISINDFRGVSAATLYDIVTTVQLDPFKADQAIIKVEADQTLSNVFRDQNSPTKPRTLMADALLNNYSLFFGYKDGNIWYISTPTFPYGLPLGVELIVGGVTIASATGVAQNQQGYYYGFYIPNLTYLIQPYIGQTLTIRISMP